MSVSTLKEQLGNPDKPETLVRQTWVEISTLPLDGWVILIKF